MDPETNIQALIASAKSDPSLRFSDRDIDRMLVSLETVKTDFLEDKTWTDIHRELLLAIRSLGINEPTVKLLYNKLAGYRYVDEIHCLHRGKYVRWISLHEPTWLSPGGIVAEIKFINTGIHVVCRLYNGKYIQYAFDECITFQKLNQEEQTILSLYSHITDTTTTTK